MTISTPVPFPRTETQRQVISAPAGRTIFLGGPGSGKTTVVAERAVAMIQTGMATSDQILVLAPSRRPVVALTELMRDGLGRIPVPLATDFQGLALTILRRHYHELGYHRQPKYLNGIRQNHFLRQILNEENPALWPVYGLALESRTVRTMISDFLRRLSENGMTLEETIERLNKEGRSDLIEIARFQRRYRNHLHKAGVVDSSELFLGVSELLLSNAAIARSYSARYRHILVDEGEDANFAHAQILRQLVDETTDLLIAGDPGQAINGFRSGGASHLIVNPKTLEATVISSPDNFRSSSALCAVKTAVLPDQVLFIITPGGCHPEESKDLGVGSDEILRLRAQNDINWAKRDLNWAKNPETLPTMKRPVLPDNERQASYEREPGPDDSFAILRPFTYPADEARWLAMEVDYLLRQGKTAGQVAVLFRNLNAPIIRLVSAELKRRGLPFGIQSSEGVLSEPLVRATVHLLRYLAQPTENAISLEKFLASPLAGLPPFGLTHLLRLAAQTGSKPVEVLSGDVDIAELPLSTELKSSLSELSKQLAALRPHTPWSAEGILWKVWQTFPAFHHDARTGGRASAVFSLLLREVSALMEERWLGLPELLGLFDQGYFDRLAGMTLARDGVTITTIHQAKGQQWDTVFLPGLTEGVFPHRPSPQDVIGTLLSRDLASQENSADLNAAVIARHLAEEQRVFYVGVSRASRNLFLSYSRRGPDGTSQALSSRFLDVIAGCPAVEVVDEERAEQLPVDPEGAVGWYRKQLNADDPLVQARAIYALQQMRDNWPRSVEAHTWWENITETAGADPPFKSSGLQLSASRLGSYRSCPLAYQFGYHWHLGEAEGPALTMGSLLHKILEEYHRPESKYPRMLSALETLLEENFDEVSFGYPALARQVKKKMSEMLEKYFDKYGLIDTVAAVEQMIRFPIGSHTITGYIDRIDELSPGNLELIDYKTGSPMSKDEAQKDIQLAIYDLAFSVDKTLGKLGNPSVVSYLYLKNIGKRADGKRSQAPTDESRQRLRRLVEYYAAMMHAERFPSRFSVPVAFRELDADEITYAIQKDSCRFCAYTWICPEHNRGDGE